MTANTSRQVPGTDDPAMVLRGLRRYYPGTKALDWHDDTSLTIERGRVHGLLGENGAGKSTLLGVIAGLSPLSAGSMELLGQPYAPDSVVRARRSGVEIVLQEPGLVPSLTVAENFLLGRGPVASRAGIVLPGRTVRAVGDALQEIAPHISPRTRAGSLCLEDRKLVELARAMHFKPSVLLVDEMSACLGHTRLELLFNALRRLRDDGVAIVYISHYLEEIHRVCDTVTVLKDGRLVETLPARTDTNTLTRLMVGRDIAATLYRTDRTENAGGERALAVDGLTLANSYRDISFTLRAGEILGIGGLVGCGSQELARTLFGDLRADAGSIALADAPFAPAGPREAIRRGVAYVPPDRDREGVILRLSILQNILLPTLRQRSRLGLYPGRSDTGISTRMINDLVIRCRGASDVPFHLSGGNRQKIVIAKWLVDPPKVLILHNPTRGIDVGAKSEIYTLIQRLAQAGTAILLLSDELPELLGMSDRILVLRRGAMTYEAHREDQPTEELLVSRMI
ncbi:sugar ABC transporter ATP-binding protein [Streptomyces iranensis]|uniref:ABC transporter related protein n=1 Tax=Streptomyces iranensis TaxID=576784 RepID=A0A060ZG37_9ACTN|nr:sugar ABC transporter ATP-binding protein [Streptomyces iranensis]MBP2062694.1 ABC-type sugar transport system ATPase subunit [Streptomyces iranensis]CDR04536.1 ABC transporter related protein [Streptomyces iranensis]